MGLRRAPNNLVIIRDMDVTMGKSRGCWGGLEIERWDIRSGEIVRNTDRHYVEHRRGELFTSLR
jgi:hypothetical protein